MERTDSPAESRSLSVVQRALEARKRLEDVVLAFDVRSITKAAVKTIASGKGRQKTKTPPSRTETQITRQFAVAALDEERGDWHAVLLEVPYPLPPEENFSFRVLTDGYLVKHLSGRGITKLNFEVRLAAGDRTLVPYGLKALWGTGARNEAGTPELEVATYSPVYPDFHSRDLVDRGRRVLYAAAEGEIQALRERGVRSKSFPGKLLADVIPAELLVNVGLIEQMDPAAFNKDPWGSVADVLMHYALNAGDAFRWIQSPANARGAYQFIRGTYEWIVGTCRGAALTSDFVRGTQNLRNMLKAAACLLDEELAKMPENAKSLFAENYRLGGIYPVAAYNGGFGTAKKLHATIKREALDLSAGQVALPKSAFTYFKNLSAATSGKTRRRTISKRTFNSETYLYLQKYFFVWDALEDFKKHGPGNAEVMQSQLS